MKKILISFSITAISGIILGGLRFNLPLSAPIVYQLPSSNDIITIAEDEWLDEGVDDLTCLLTDGKYENHAW